MKTKVRAIDSLWTFCVAVAVVGPFALPLLWRNPRFTKKTKLAGSAFIILLTALLLWISGKLAMDIHQNLQTLQQIR